MRANKRIGQIAVCYLSACMATSGADAPSTSAAGGIEIVHQSGETNGVNLNARIQRRNRLGDAIYVDFTLTNNRDVPILLDHNDNRGDIWMKLTTDRGVVVPRTDFGRLFTDPYAFGRNIPLHLRPHEVMHRRYDLLEYFQITEVGHYRLSVLRTVDGTEADPTAGGEDQEVDVGPIRFYVE